jgi:hypothetical protein
MALWWTRPPTEMSIRDLPGGKRRPAHKAGNFTAICESIAKIMWDPRRLTTLCTSSACYRNRIVFDTDFCKVSEPLNIIQTDVRLGKINV